MLQAADLNHPHGEVKLKSGRARRAHSKVCKRHRMFCFVATK